MSHYSVMVCLPRETDQADIESALEKVLAPFDENMNVEPYRSYEDGSAEEYWWVSSVRRGAAHLKDGTGVNEHDLKSHSYGKPPLTVEEKRAEYEEDARWAATIGEPATWKAVVEQYNAKWHPKNAVATGDEVDDPDDGLFYEAETDRAYTMSTYNPESKWDYWRIGGRWSGYFIADGMEEFILLPERHWDGPKDLGRGRCDGGRIRSLDLAAMREEAAVKANGDYDRWEKRLPARGEQVPPGVARGHLARRHRLPHLRSAAMSVPNSAAVSTLDGGQ